MDKTDTLEFHIDPAAVRLAAQRSLLLRAGIVLGILAAFALSIDAWVPPKHITLAWSFALSLAAVYVAVEISALQWAKRSAPTMVVRLTSRAMELWIGTGRHAVPYATLSIDKVQRRGNAVRSIHLRTSDSGRFALTGFFDMQGLADELVSRVAGARSDKR